MKVARRAFLQFAAGAVGGTLLSPIPWQLADDTAIWSQNWSWRPSPERGEITKIASICTLCDGGCGIEARLVNGKRAIYLNGNVQHPVNQGGICPLGAAGLQFLYAPYRIPQPLKQTKKRGDPTGFQPISWNDALAELGRQLAQLKSEGKAHTVAGITGQRNSSMCDLWQHFFAAYGSPNFFKMPSHADSLELAAMAMLGQSAPFAFGVEKASYILSFGANLIGGWGAPTRMQAAYRRWREEVAGKSTKVVQVQSNCSMTAAKADQWVAVAPGTEAALALGIARVMVEEKLYDTDFVASYVNGFEDWTDKDGKKRKGFKSLVLSPEYAPDEIAKVTGVDAGKIKELGREFGKAANALAIWGENQGDVPGNFYHDLVFASLNVLKGNLKSGTLFSTVPKPPFEPLSTDTLKTPTQKRLDMQQGTVAPLCGNAVHAFLDTVAKGGAYPIQVLMVHEANPAYCLFENRVFLAALEKIGYLVSFSSYMDETARQADLILPNHMALERCDDVTWLPGVPYAYYALSIPILKPQLDTKHTGDVLLGLVKALGGDVSSALPWDSYESFLKKRVESLASTKKGAVAKARESEPWKLNAGDLVEANYKDGADLLKALKAGCCWYDAPVDPMQNNTTGSGKIEISLNLLQTKGIAGAGDETYLPHFVQLSPSGGPKEFPLLLISYKNLAMASDFLPNPPFMNKAIFDFTLKGRDLFVEIHPNTARSLGLGEGDRAVLKTPVGEVSVRVHLFPGARAGAVYMAQGLGHTAYDQYIQDKGVNANSVSEVQMDPVTGLGTVWATRAQLRRA